MKHKLAEVSEIPKDIKKAIPLLCVTGNNEICLENHGGIIEYTDIVIRIRTKYGHIRISGKGLYIDYYTNDEVKLNGKIEAIEFVH